MTERAASPRLVKFVRRALRAEPRPTFEEVLARWRAQPRSDESAELVLAVYDDELANFTEPGAAEQAQTRVVLITVGIWIAVHTVLALGIGLPSFVDCRGSGSSGAVGACGLGLGLTFLSVAVVQVIYGLIAALIVYRRRRPVAQGILIGLSSVLLLFTVLCFGATVTG
jgi:hypothetical protein